MATATTKVETTVTLTLSQAEAEAVLVLTGCVSGGGNSSHRDATDNVFDALRSALNKSSHETDFFQSLDHGFRTISLL